MKLKVSKKLGLTVAAVSLVGAMAIGGTLAWFTDTAEVTNTATFGNVAIKLTEDDVTNSDPDVRTETGNDYGLEIEPGITLVKDPTVENTGTNDAYVRLKVEVSAKGADGSEYADLAAVVMDTIDAAVTVKNPTREADLDTVDNGTNAIYTYKNKLVKDEAKTLFEELTFDPAIYGNEFANIKVEIKVTADAMQTTNLGDNVTDAVAAFAMLDAGTVDYSTGKAPVVAPQ